MDMDVKGLIDVGMPYWATTKGFLLGIRSNVPFSNVVLFGSLVVAICYRRYTQVVGLLS